MNENRFIDRDTLNRRLKDSDLSPRTKDRLEMLSDKYPQRVQVSTLPAHEQNQLASAGLADPVEVAT